jgi:hypothetical protein
VEVFTNYPDRYDNNDDAWRLDDGDPRLARVGEAFIEKAIEVGVPTISAAHKGFSRLSPHATSADVGPAARKHPDANFVVHQSGYETTHPPEGPSTKQYLVRSIPREGHAVAGEVERPTTTLYFPVGLSMKTFSTTSRRSGLPPGTERPLAKWLPQNWGPSFSMTLRSRSLTSAGRALGAAGASLQATVTLSGLEGSTGLISSV